MWASRKRVCGLLLAAAVVAACRPNPAPRGWLAPAERAAADPYGAWIVVQLRGAPSTDEVRGEFIAVSNDSVFVLTQAAEFRAVAQADAARALVASYASQYDLLAVWSLMGTLATASHGWFAIASAPVWLITGPIATASQSRAPLEDVTPDRGSWVAWVDVSMYARFPQGLPLSLNRSQLRPKSIARQRP